MYIEHRHRVYGILRIYHVQFFDQIAYGHAYSTLLHHVVWCVEHKIVLMETGLYYKIFQHLCAGYKYHYEHDIPFLSTFIYLPVFLFFLINHSMLVCRSRQVFLKFSGQTHIRCTVSIVNNHKFFINLYTQ